MNINELLKMNDSELKQQYIKVRRANDLETISIINTIRINNWLQIALQLFSKEKDIFFYYEDNGKRYFYPKLKKFNPTITDYVEWQIIAHMNGYTPVLVKIELLQNLISTNRIRFVKSDEKINIPIMENILNYNYETENIQEIKMPDIWVPNSEKELEIAVFDMPKNDEESVLLTNTTSYLIIGNYKTSNRTFTDIFYSPNQAGEIPKAIILNDIVGIKGDRLENELQHQLVKYTKKQNEADTYKINESEGILIDLDLSTIWTAKFKEIIADAIIDSQEKESFTETMAEIYNVPSKIVTTIRYNGQSFSLNVTYNTVILFDDKLILYEANYRDENRTEIVELFACHGLTAIVMNEPIDLSFFKRDYKRSKMVK